MNCGTNNQGTPLLPAGRRQHAHPSMSELAPQAELLRSLGQLVRGLSALFWGLPLALLVSVKTALSDWLRPLGIVPPILALGLICYGLWQLGHFQKQERIWTRALDRAKLLGFINLGLSPFLYWWNKLPSIPFYAMTIALLMLSGLLFLFDLNQVLQRLGAMLPDETLRLETKWFTSMNLGLLIFIVVAVAIYAALEQVNHLPRLVLTALQTIEPVRSLLVVLLVLLPLALTMTLIWKIKEVVLHSVFSPQN
jgi:hypothetical protein